MATPIIKLVDASGTEAFLTDNGESIRIVWRNGPRSSRFFLTVTADNDAAFRTFLNPCTLTVKGVHYGDPEGSGQRGEKATDFQWVDLWLVEPVGAASPVDPSITVWYLEDSRRFAQNLTSIGMMNAQRVGNEREDAIEEGGNFNQFFRIPKFVTLKNTMKAPGAIQFARFDEEAPEIWTAFEGLQWMLGAYFDQDVFATSEDIDTREKGLENPKPRAQLPDGSRFKPKIVYRDLDGSFKTTPPQGLENEFPIQIFNLNGPWATIVSKLLRLAHCGMVPNNKGEWVVHRMDPKAFPRKVGEYEGGGFVIQPDAKNRRAINHRTYVRTRYEWRADFVENVGTIEKPNTTTVTDDDAVLPIPLINYAVNPFDLIDPDDPTKILTKGSIYPFELLIRAWNNEKSRVFPPEFINNFGKLTLPFIKKAILTPMLAMNLTFDVRIGGQRNQLGAAIASTIYDFYRTLLGIPQDFRDQLKRIRPDMVRILDTRTNRVAPSRAFVDHTIVSSYHGAFIAGAGDHQSGLVDMSPWPVGDTNKLIEQARASEHIRVTLFNDSLGIFRLKPLVDVAGNFSRVMFTTFRDLPFVNMVGIDGIPRSLEKATQEDEYRASFLFSSEILSVSPKTTVVIEKGINEAPADGRGPVYEEQLRSIFAAMAWVDGRTEAGFDNQTGAFEVKGHEWLNKLLIESAARGLRDQFYFAQQDWVLGEFFAPSFDPEKDIPAGNYDVSFNYADGLFEAGYYATRPRSKPFFETLIPEAAELLFRFDEGTL